MARRGCGSLPPMLRLVTVVASCVLLLGCSDDDRPSPYMGPDLGGSSSTTGPGGGNETNGIGGAGGAGPGDCNQVESVLFIGNSYTAYNDLPGLVGSFAIGQSCSVNIESNTPGGVSFADHLQDATTLRLLEQGGWDAVVLQNFSQTPSQPPEEVEMTSLLDAEALADLARQHSPDARIVYYVTWGRRDGDADNCDTYPKVCTFEGHTEALIEGYEMYATATDGELARVGPAWRFVVEDPDAPEGAAELWTNDGSHPTLAGSYLAASVIFLRLFDRPSSSDFEAGVVLADYYRSVAEMRP